MQNVFKEGYDPTADPTIPANVASAILQAVRQATGVGITGSTPTGTALVLFGTTAPDIVANPFFATCLWVDQSDAAKPLIRWYNPATPAWEPFKPKDLSIKAESIADGIITVSKLAPTGGAAHNLIRLISPLPAIPPYFEFVDPTALFPNNTVNPNVLQIGGSGTYLTSDGVSATWKVLDSATIISLLANHSIKPTLLEGTSIPYPGTVMFSWGGNVGWATPAQLSELLFTQVKANTQIPNILISGNPGQVLTTKSDGSVDWVTPTTPTVLTTYTFDDVKTVAFRNSSSYVASHSLGAIYPKIVQAFLVCNTIDAGYAVGDEVNVCAFIRLNSVMFTSVFTVFTDKTNATVGVAVNDVTGGGTGSFVCHKTTGANTAIDPAHWNIRIRVTN